MKRDDIIDKLKAGAELIDDTFWGYHRCWLSSGWTKVLYHQFEYLKKAGLISKVRNDKDQAYYRWSGPTPTAGTGTPSTPQAG